MGKNDRGIRVVGLFSTLLTLIASALSLVAFLKFKYTFYLIMSFVWIALTIVSIIVVRGKNEVGSR
ncbi:MAG: hypothetical protein LRS41_07280 [Caldisphaeraceae archaeon]|nr:hypothetical protein [Caldisphaeraceae archaeon]